MAGSSVLTEMAITARSAVGVLKARAVGCAAVCPVLLRALGAPPPLPLN